MKLGQVLEKTIQFFKDKGSPSARLDSELLISSALGFERIQLYLKYDQPLKEDELQRCRDLVRRRSTGEPVAYILGEKGFYGNQFQVGPGVLIPRPETEILVEEALNWSDQQSKQDVRILDIGCGSGCIGLSILLKLENAHLTSIDRSPSAIDFTKKNIQKLELSGRVEVHQFDASNSAEAARLENSFDIIVANPPYISEDDSNMDAHVKEFEPKEALFSGDHGMEDIKKWSQRYSKKLNNPGIMLMEIGYNQGPATKKWFEELNVFSKVRIIKDLSGHDRVIEGVING